MTDSNTIVTKMATKVWPQPSALSRLGTRKTMPIVDTEQLLEYLEGDLELLRDAFDVFCEVSQVVQVDLQSAVSAGDISAVHKLAHKIRGMLSNFQAPAACDTAQEVELIVDPDQLKRAQPLIDKLRRQIESVRTEVNQILQTGASGKD
jgi:HPt (histidine-containing phosphotransfer) domain-containing protein